MQKITREWLETELTKTLADLEAEYEFLSKSEEAQEIAASEETQKSEADKKDEEKDEDVEEKEDAKKAEDCEDEEADEEDDQEDLKKPMKKKLKKEEKEDDEEDEHEDEKKDKKLISEMIEDSKKIYKMEKSEAKIQELEKALADSQAKINELTQTLEGMKKSEAPKMEQTKEEVITPASAAPLAKSEDYKQPEVVTKKDVLEKCFEQLGKYVGEGNNIQADLLKSAINKFDVDPNAHFNLIKSFLK